MKITDEAPMHAGLQRWRDEDHEETIALSREQVIEICEEFRALSPSPVGVGDEIEALRRAVWRLSGSGMSFVRFWQVYGDKLGDLTKTVVSREEAALASHEPTPRDTQEGLSVTGEVVGWAYEHHDFGDVWARGVILNRPDGGANPPTKHHGSPIRNVAPLVRLSTLTACQQEVERLRAKVEELDGECQQSMLDICRERERAEIAEARNAELVKALEPFTQFFDKAMEGFTEGYADRKPEEKTVLGWNDANLLMADFNRARAALRPENEGE